MIPALIAVAASLAVGLLLGGCTAGDSELSESLLTRNAQLENQLMTHQSVLIGLSAILVLMSCGLAGALLLNSKSKGAPSDIQPSPDQDPP